jgi:hypothetical protein
MAISPNTNFTSGQILTAAQQNQFPRGIVAFNESTSTVGVGTSTTLTITASTFTAVANRYYKITYIEPDMGPGGIGNRMDVSIRLNNAAGAQIQLMYTTNQQTANADLGFICQWVGTLTAGSTVIVGCGKATTACNWFANTNEKRQIIVEDIGPA